MIQVVGIRSNPVARWGKRRNVSNPHDRAFKEQRETEGERSVAWKWPVVRPERGSPVSGTRTESILPWTRCHLTRAVRQQSMLPGATRLYHAAGSAVNEFKAKKA